MDVLSLVGFALALIAVVGGHLLEGGHLSSLFNPSAFTIVIGGTLAASLVQSPLPEFRAAMQRLRWVVRPPWVPLDALIAKIVHWSVTARREGLLGLEGLIERERDPFAAKALQMLVDGAEPEDIRHAMEIELGAREDFELRTARLFESMGGYAPTIGILGAVLGLIQVMENLADPTRLGSGIAAAFVATVYGVGLANLVLIPVANKLKAVIRHQSQASELLLEGIVAIARGENPRNIELRLRGYLQS